MSNRLEVKVLLRIARQLVTDSEVRQLIADYSFLPELQNRLKGIQKLHNSIADRIADVAEEMVKKEQPERSTTDACRSGGAR